MTSAAFRHRGVAAADGRREAALYGPTSPDHRAFEGTTTHHLAPHDPVASFAREGARRCTLIARGGAHQHDLIRGRQLAASKFDGAARCGCYFCCLECCSDALRFRQLASISSGQADLCTGLAFRESKASAAPPRPRLQLKTFHVTFWV